MSWSVYAMVEDGDVAELFEKIDANNATAYPQPVNSSVLDQQKFVVDVIQQAFESEVVDGLYSVSVGGHSNPDYPDDRKSLSIVFSPSVGMPTPPTLEPGETPVAPLEEGEG